MHKQLPAWLLISESLSLQIPVMLLYVLESKGSSPGRQGFMMVLNAQGVMQGSIGGGIMEHKFIEMCRDMLKQDAFENSIRLQVHDKAPAKNQSGMICSGEQTNFLYRVSTKDKDAIDALVKSLNEGKHGTLSLSPSGIMFSPGEIPGQDFVFRYEDEQHWLYEEKTGYKNRLVIVGGGHCALALSRIMSMMDFFIQVYDHRSQLNTLSQNIFAQEKIVIDDYAEIRELVREGSHVYVLIMTFGYRTDDISLRALLHKKFDFIGMLGSKSKIEKMFNEYRKEGINESLLKNIQAPVGLQIHSQTPEEIAISIAAQIIALKNAT